jgi:predicted MFS family arabinose efflux permease
MIAVLLIVVAFGQLLGYGLVAGSSPWWLVASMAIAGVATGLLNALLGREAVASVGRDRPAMGSGTNNTARNLGAAFGIPPFVVIATHVGDDLIAGWNAAVLVSAALTLTGACTVVFAGKPDRTKALTRATNVAWPRHRFTISTTSSPYRGCPGWRCLPTAPAS